MESNYELKEIDIKKRTCYYFDDIININNLDPNNVLSDEIILNLAVFTPQGF